MKSLWLWCSESLINDIQHRCRKLVEGISTKRNGLIKKLSEVTNQVKLNKKTILLQQGKISKEVYFIEKGFARAYYHIEDQETTSWFMGEGDVIISVYSFYSQKPSFENIELLEDSVLTSLSYSALQEIYREFVKFNIVGRILTENITC